MYVRGVFIITRNKINCEFLEPLCYTGGGVVGYKKYFFQDTCV
jgi:hypothetical protein